MNQFAAATLLCLGIAPILAAEPVAQSERQAEVRSRSAEVMPFSMDATQHVFDKTAQGGVQRVEARSGHDEQVPLIRSHLSDIAAAFARRDFVGPARIHGEEMPGLAELRAAPPEALTVRYRDLPNGGEVRYEAATPALTDAIHRWFDAQLSDHGHDAMTHHHEPPAE